MLTFILKVKKTIKLFFIILLLVYSVNGQDSVIVCPTGNVYYPDTNHKNWLLLTRDTKMALSGSIKIAKGASVIIVAEGRLLKKFPEKESAELITPLLDILPEPAPEGLLQNIKVFLSEILFKEEEYNAPVIHKGGLINFPMLFPADSEVMHSTNITFKWNRDTRDFYYFLLKENGDSQPFICVNEHVTDTVLLPNNKAVCADFNSFSNSANYIWTIAIPENKETQGIFLNFSFASKELLDTVNNLLAAIEKEGNNEVRLLLKAACYEKYNMFTEADKVYATLTRSYPQSAMANNAYKKFIQRIVRRNSVEAK